MVEPGFFRTNFLDESSPARTALEIDDYRDSVGKTRAHAADVNGGQRGDPRKLAQAFLQLANAKSPPLRLPLGTDTLKVETHARFGAQAEVLCDLAAHLEADLIVVGNRGMQGGRRFLGSVPNTVTHRAPCAVLVVKTT